MIATSNIIIKTYRIKEWKMMFIIAKYNMITRLQKMLWITNIIRNKKKESIILDILVLCFLQWSMAKLGFMLIFNMCFLLVFVLLVVRFITVLSVPVIISIASSTRPLSFLVLSSTEALFYGIKLLGNSSNSSRYRRNCKESQSN